MAVGDQPPVAGRIGGAKAEHRDARVMLDRAAHPLQRLGAISGVSPKITRMSSAPLFDRGARGEHRVRGAAPLGLHEHLGLRQHAPRLVGDRVRVRTDHHGGRFDAGAAHRREHMGEQRAAGDRVQHLRQRGTHARALAGGEHDREAGRLSHRRSDVEVGRRHTGGTGPEERWKAGTASTAYGGNQRILLPFFNAFDSFPEPALMTAVRRMQLARLGVWIGLATVAVLTAVLAARTETGVRRIATPALARAAGAAGAQREGATPQLAQPPVRPGGGTAPPERGDPHARRRPRPAARPPQHARTQYRGRHRLDRGAGRESRRPPPLPSIRPRRRRRAAPRRSRAAAPRRRRAGQSRVAAGHLATGNPTAAESVATKTEFGVDLGGNATIDGLRTLWSNLKTSQPAMLEGLRPVIAIREGQKPGAIELRLVAGPLANASIAARLCAALAAAGQSCQPDRVRRAAAGAAVSRRATSKSVAPLALARHRGTDKSDILQAALELLRIE